MKEIKLTNGYTAKVDDIDHAWLSKWTWTALVLDKGVTYAIRTVYKPKRTVYMHVEINGPGTDHEDLDKLNNQRYNLRSATRQQNACNYPKRSGTTSKYKGVSKRKDNGLYRVSIRFNGVLKCLGHFTDEIHAAKVYDIAAKILFGKFARLNFPETK